MLAAAAASLQSCPTLCDPIDGSPPASPVPGILQARTLEWVCISFSNEWKWKVKVKSLSRVQLLVTPWTAAYQAPPPMGFSRQEYCSGLPLPSLIKCLGPNKEDRRGHTKWDPIYHVPPIVFPPHTSLVVLLQVSVGVRVKNGIGRGLVNFYSKQLWVNHSFDSSIRPGFWLTHSLWGLSPSQ